MPRHAREGARGSADPLFDLLHREHEEVDRALGELLATDDPARARELWRACAVALSVHVRTEQVVVYDVLERDQEDAVGEAREEHEQIEDLVADADAASPGTGQFFARIAELRELVRHHVGHEEGTLLPEALRTVDERERAEMVDMFRERAGRLRPKLEAERSAAPAEATPAVHPRRVRAA